MRVLYRYEVSIRHAEAPSSGAAAPPGDGGVMDRLIRLASAFQPAIAIIMTVATAAMIYQFSLSNEFARSLGKIEGQQASLASLAGTVASLSQDVGDIYRQIETNAVILAKVEQNMVTMGGRVGLIQAQIKQAETDPRIVLERQGFFITESFGAAFINGQIYVFPMTAEGVKVLTDFGLTKHALSPVVSGFAITK